MAMTNVRRVRVFMRTSDGIRNCMLIVASIIGMNVISASGQNAAISMEQKPYEIPSSAPRILGMTLLNSNFSDAEQILGKAYKYRASHAEEAPIQICYRSEVKGDSTLLILESDFTGAWVDLSGYKLTTNQSNQKHPCTPSKMVAHTLKVLDAHVWLGMTKNEVIASLGKPRTRNFDKVSKDELPNNNDPDHWVYLTTWAIPFTEADKIAEGKTFGADSLGENPHWDAWNDVELTFKSSKLVEVYVYHGVSY